MGGGRMAPEIGDRYQLEASGFGRLFDALRGGGYTIVGPTIREGAIVYDELESPADLPAGWTDQQDGGTYRLVRRDDDALFGYAVGPQSWKKYLFPPFAQLWRAQRDGDTFDVYAQQEDPPLLAFLGVRSCELHAIAIQDRIFLQGPAVDPIYKARRERTFIVALDCSVAGGTCFCVSMGTGPHATFGFDLALTELLDGAVHRFVVHAGSARGVDMLRDVPLVPADQGNIDAARDVVERTASQMGRAMETEGIKELLYRNLEHPRWDDVATRCLTCANCTMVCPTCFCSTTEDTSDLAGDVVERTRTWDSCFTADFSQIHGGLVRASGRSRYRQWMTHKLATWIDQFGTSGCVGCGRCITWCPVGIDITEEVAAIRATEQGALDGNA